MNPTIIPNTVGIKTERGFVVEDLNNSSHIGIIGNINGNNDNNDNNGNIGNIGNNGNNGNNGNIGNVEAEKKPLVCAKCSQVIKDRFYLRVMDRCWHDQCLRCDYCACQLGDAYNQSLYTRDNRLLCKTDYMRMYGAGKCAACLTQIPAFEMVMRARRNVYHLECFACQDCSHRFCVGDRFYMFDNRVLCGQDYAERTRVANSENIAQIGQRENVVISSGMKRKMPTDESEHPAAKRPHQQPQQQAQTQSPAQLQPQQQQQQHRQHQQPPPQIQLNVQPQQQPHQQQLHQLQYQQQQLQHGPQQPPVKRRHLDLIPSTVAVR